MDWNYESGIDLLAEARKVLPGGVAGCVKILFDGTTSLSELFHKIIQFLIERRIPVPVVNVTVELGICEAGIFRLTLLQNLIQVRQESKHNPLEDLECKTHIHLSSFDP